MDIPAQTIERLSAYRRQLVNYLKQGKMRVFSHELAAREPVTPAQIRRDLMTIGFSGSPSKGYDILGLVEHIGDMLDPPHGEGLALVGVGHLGRAIIDHFGGHPLHHLTIIAAFDTDPQKVGRVFHGCRCHSIDDLEQIIEPLNISVGIVTVPAESAQAIADRLVAAGVRGICNFAPARLSVPDHIHLEDVDISRILEKVAFIARSTTTPRSPGARAPVGG
jgi:redox-sensing transcriptional repressor